MAKNNKIIKEKSAQKYVFIGLIVLLIIAGALAMSRQFTAEKTITVNKLDNLSQASATVTATTAETPAMVKTKLLKGKVEALPGVAPESLTIVGLANTTAVDQQGNFSVKTYEDGVTTVAAMAQGKEFGLIKIVVASTDAPEDNFNINATTTAVGLVFMTPFFITNEPERANEILKVIDHDPKVQALAQVITAVFNQADPLSDPVYEQAFKAAIQSVAFTLNQ